MRTLAIVALALLVVPFARGQGPLENRIPSAVSNFQLRQLRGNVHPLARVQFDRGKAPDSTVLPRITVFLAPSAAQQAALGKLLSEQQDLNSPNYHHWLSPEEFGARFGVSQDDMNKVVA